MIATFQQVEIGITSATGAMQGRSPPLFTSLEGIAVMCLDPFWVGNDMYLLSLILGCNHVGGVLGYTLGLVNQNLEKQAASMPNRPPTMATGSFSGPPKVLALNLAVFTAVQAGLTLAVKRYRGVEDIQTNMIGMFGAGASLSLTTNIFGDQPASPGQVKPTTTSGYIIDAVRTGALFAALNGAFMKVGQRFGGKNAPQDVYYYHTFGMLSTLGLEKYEKNFRRGQLMDDCLGLLSDSALQEIKIPPGPRLKILNYVAASKVIVTAETNRYIGTQETNTSQA